MAGEFTGPSIRVINGTESRLTTPSSEIEAVEKTRWSDLFLAYSTLDSRIGRQMGPAVIPIEVGFPIELEESPEDYCSVSVRSFFIDPLMHFPELLIVTVALNDDNYMRGFCSATWEKGKPKLGKVQYHFNNGHTKDDFYDVLELTAVTINAMHADLPQRKLD